MRQPKIALATEFLVQYGGAQKTLEAISEIFPEAPIYTAKYNPKDLSSYLNSRKIMYPKGAFTNFLSKNFFIFAMAPIFESMDFRDYDIVISDGTTWTKGIITKPDQLHFSYVHTPPRFLYGYAGEGSKWDKPLLKLPFAYMKNFLRMWDYTAAQRPDFLFANSKEVQKRITKFYGRDSTVIYPPIELDYAEKMKKADVDVIDPVFITAGRLAAYKNFDLVIKVFNELKKPLVVIGTGNDEKKLHSIAGPTISFLGKAPEEVKHAYMHKCIGLINPVTDEDFGIVPLEVSAHGKPVLASRAAGHLETVIDGVTGSFFDELTVPVLKEAVLKFEKDASDGKFDAKVIKEHAQKFSKERFKSEIRDFVMDKWEEFCATSERN